MNEFFHITRRAFLQSVRADETLIEKSDIIIKDENANSDLKQFAMIIKENSENRKKALMQVVRYVERSHGFKKSKIKKENKKYEKPL